MCGTCDVTYDDVDSWGYVGDKRWEGYRLIWVIDQGAMHIGYFSGMIDPDHVTINDVTILSSNVYTL